MEEQVKESGFTLSKKVEISSGLINVIVAGYQIALNKTLGPGAAAMTQLLIKDIGEFLEDLLEDAGFELHDISDLSSDIPKAFQMLGISQRVEVETPSNGSNKGDKYIIKIYDSIFRPVALLLEKKGIKFTLSPESFLAAALVRKAIRKQKSDAQIKIKVRPQKSPDEPLVVEVEVR